MFGSLLPPGKLPKDKELRAKVLREKTERLYDTPDAGLPLEAWQAFKGIINYTLPSKEVLREEDLLSSGENSTNPESGEVKILPIPLPICCSFFASRRPPFSTAGERTRSSL